MTRKMWKITKEKMLPTPSKFHYVFNLRDLSRIWLGMIGVTSQVLKIIRIKKNRIKNILSGCEHGRDRPEALETRGHSNPLRQVLLRHSL